MGLDIYFLESTPETEELQGSRLTSTPGFFIFTHVLSKVMANMEEASRDEDSTEARNCYRRCEEYADRFPEAGDIFSRYMGFIPLFKQFGATELEFPEEIDGYHPLAVHLAAALMLRDEPVTASEAEEILKFLPFLHGWSRSVLLFLPVDREKSQRMVGVLDRYMKCLEVAAGNNLSFRVDF